MDERYQLVAEAAPAQAYEVQAAIACGLLASDDVRRNVLTEAAAALYHHVATNLAELMTENDGADDSVVVNLHFSCEFRGVAYNDVVAENAIVGNVHVLHEQVVVSDNGSTLRGCTT